MLKDFDVNAPLMRQPVPHDYRQDIEAVGRIEAVPRILDVICKTTGLGFAAVARVTNVRDALLNLSFGNIALTVHEGRVVQIDITEKKRLNFS